MRRGAVRQGKGRVIGKGLTMQSMRGWESKCERQGTGRGARNEFRVKWSLGIGQRSAVRSVSSLEPLVVVKSETQHTPVYQAS